MPVTTDELVDALLAHAPGLQGRSRAYAVRAAQGLRFLGGRIHRHAINQLNHPVTSAADELDDALRFLFTAACRWIGVAADLGGDPRAQAYACIVFPDGASDGAGERGNAWGIA